MSNLEQALRQKLAEIKENYNEWLEIQIQSGWEDAQAKEYAAKSKAQQLLLEDILEQAGLEY